MRPAPAISLAPRRDPTRDETARVRLAASPETSAELLHALATDPLVTVRAAVALNPSAPAGLDSRIATDGDARVRALLAHKLATLLPHVCGPERERLREHALSTLTVLVEDEAVRVRAAIADVVKDMPQAPRELILRLARDAAIPVSEQVIRLSPLLTADDLLSLLDRPAGPCTALAVARRPGLDESVADAIAATANHGAIAALLRNHSAAIREATLDALAARAAAHEDWHDPLARRPRLSAAAARALSEFVATGLLEVLAGRCDLDPAIMAELQQRLTERLQPAAPTFPPRHPASMDEAMASARTLLRDNRLDELAVLAAAQRGDARLCAALLAVAGDVPVAVVERAATLRSAKGLVSLVWAAGFTMRARPSRAGRAGRAGPQRRPARDFERRFSTRSGGDALATRPVEAPGAMTSQKGSGLFLGTNAINGYFTDVLLPH